MGKLRFTLTGVIFWVALVLSCLLSENFAIFNPDPMKGFSGDSAFILTISIIALLVLYYFLEHKKNGLKFDKILLPSICVAGLLLILNIMRQTTRSFISYSGAWDFTITFSAQDRLMASLQVVIWLGVIYALIFVYNRFRLNKESYRWIAKLYLLATVIMCIIDIYIDKNEIMAILTGSGSGYEVAFVMGNANVWSLLIFSAILSTILLSYKRFRWYYFVAMICLFLYNTLTTCATTIFISLVAIVAYVLFEILSRYKTNKKRSLILLAVYLGTCIAAWGIFAILVKAKVPLFYNFWEFISHDVFAKNVTTLSGRTDIWRRVWGFMSRNPLDLIFGLGHGTGSFIYQEYMGHTVKSAHNALLEIFLRYGFIGLAIYIGMLGLTVYCLIRHIKEKNYRFAFIYGLCFLCIMAHSLTESTTLFTPNVGGLYFSFVFVLPILNIIQKKHFKELKEDLLTADVSRQTIKQSSVITAVIYTLFAVVLTKILKDAFNIGILRSIFVLLMILVLGCFVFSLMKKDNAFNVISNNWFLMYKNQVSKEKDDE